MTDWLVDVSLPAKMVQGSYRIEVVYHTTEGRYVEVVKDRRTDRTSSSELCSRCESATLRS